MRDFLGLLDRVCREIRGSKKWWVWSKGPFVVCPTPLPVRTANTGPRPAPGLTSAPRDQICLLRPSAAAAARTGGSSPSRGDRDEHGHHRVDDAGVPGGGPEPGLHQSGRQLLGARLRPPHHHLRRLHHRRLPLWDQAGDPGAVDGDWRTHRGHGRVHVRLPELRRPPHGLLPQRSRGRALQEQAAVRTQPRPASLSRRKCYDSTLPRLASVLDLGAVWPRLNKCGMLLHSCEDLTIHFVSSYYGSVQIWSLFLRIYGFQKQYMVRTQ